MCSQCIGIGISSFNFSIAIWKEKKSFFLGDCSVKACALNMNIKFLVKYQKKKLLKFKMNWIFNSFCLKMRRAALQHLTTHTNCQKSNFEASNIVYIKWRNKMSGSWNECTAFLSFSQKQFVSAHCCSLFLLL